MLSREGPNPSKIELPCTRELKFWLSGWASFRLLLVAKGLKNTTESPTEVSSDQHQKLRLFVESLF